MEFEVAPLSDDASIVSLNGRLDTLGVDAIETRFNASVVATHRNVALDLSGVSFLSSMGIRLLITAARTMHARQRRLVVFGAQTLVAEVLETAALNQIIPVLADRQGAIERLAATS